MVGKDEGSTVTYNVVVISNPFWPGFYTFYNDQKKSWSHIYLGNGMKGKQFFIPIAIPDILKESKDIYEQIEPNHFEKPKVENDDDV
jgi:Radial spokehead-like protein